jgi:uncharacterized protein YebE (UPF0316 family)
VLPSAVLPLAIFCLRVADMSIDTLRVLFVIRGRKALAWILGFAQSAIWVTAISNVLANLDNPLNLVGYAAGFASGNVVGMWIEERLALGHAHIRVVSSGLGSALAEALRNRGFAATELSGRGMDGTVTILNCNVRRRDIDRAQREITRVDPRAFITVEEVRPLHRGFWRS